jgi:hypothetical protein
MHDLHNHDLNKKIGKRGIPFLKTLGTAQTSRKYMTK